MTIRERRAHRAVLPLALALACAAVTSFAFARPTDDEPQGPICGDCDSTGRLVCEEHDPDDCELEDAVVYCSVMDGCLPCGGTGWIDCEDCEFPATEQRLARSRADFERARESNAWIAEELEFDVRHAESEHFVLIWEMEGMKVDRRRKTAHEMMHLTLERMETLFDLYLETLGAREGEFGKKALIAVWEDPSDQEHAGGLLTGSSSVQGSKLLGPGPRYTCCGGKRFFPGDEELHRNLVHNVSHLLLSSQRPARWIGNEGTGGWADAGLAHWFEFTLTGECRNYCYEEVNTKRDWKGGKFKVGVRKLVALGKQPSMSSVMNKKTTQLTPEEHALSFSYFDYLVTRDGERTNDLLRRLRQRQATRDALKASFDLTILEFEELWREWVMETYPTR